jgi:diphthamide synthase (EF-2-diphthine--ammonia ligase)
MGERNIFSSNRVRIIRQKQEKTSLWRMMEIRRDEKMEHQVEMNMIILSAKVDTLVELLIKKGVATEEEYISELKEIIKSIMDQYVEVSPDLGFTAEDIYKYMDV